MQSPQQIQNKILTLTSPNKYKSKIINASAISVNRADTHSNKLVLKPCFLQHLKLGIKEFIFKL